jgi:hypothetical protein
VRALAQRLLHRARIQAIHAGPHASHRRRKRAGVSSVNQPATLPSMEMPLSS